MSRSSESPLPLDHLVLPVADLAVSRARLGALGFRVAPEGVHPFGTRNACAYLADGTFLEMLGFGDGAVRAEAEHGGNVFVLRDRMFREKIAPEGLSALVFATDDASADHARYLGAGISAGEELYFSRPFVDAAGKSDTAAFRLAFAAGGSAVPFFFACERVNAPAVDRTELERHENKATRIAAVKIVAKDIGATAKLVSRISGAAADATGDSVELHLPNAVLDISGPESVAQYPDAGDFAFDGVTVGVPDLRSLRSLFSRTGIEYQDNETRLVVPKAPGQGVDFTFEESA